MNTQVYLTHFKPISTTKFKPIDHWIIYINYNHLVFISNILVYFCELHVFYEFLHLQISHKRTKIFAVHLLTYYTFQVEQDHRVRNDRPFAHWFEAVSITIVDTRPAGVLILVNQGEVFENAGGQAVPRLKLTHEILRRRHSSIRRTRLCRSAVHKYPRNPHRGPGTLIAGAPMDKRGPSVPEDRDCFLSCSEAHHHLRSEFHLLAKTVARPPRCTDFRNAPRAATIL